MFVKIDEGYICNKDFFFLVFILKHLPYASIFHKINKNNKLSSNTNLGNSLYTEIGAGILANTSLLLFHVVLSFLRHKSKPTDLPIGVLALVHLVMLLINVLIHMDVFSSWGGRWGSVTCKLVIYTYRSMRGLSMCTTCLLSILQAVILCPRGSWLARFKQTSSLRSLCCILVLWVVHTAFGSHLLVSIIATHNLTSDNLMYITESCSLLPMGSFLRHTVSVLLTSREVVMAGLMAVSSGYMVTLLCRHKRRSQHLHSARLSPRASPEQRATWTILLLTSCFVVISILDGFVSHARYMVKDDPVFYCIQILVVHSYATVSPVFISKENHMTNVLRSLGGKPVNI